MKLSQCIYLLSITTSSAFTTPLVTNPSFKNRYLSASTADESDFQSQLEGPSIYDKLGFKEEELAIGVDPEEFLQWLGT